MGNGTFPQVRSVWILSLFPKVLAYRGACYLSLCLNAQELLHMSEDEKRKKIAEALDEHVSNEQQIYAFMHLH